jgi:shikimate kinase
MNRTQNVFLIGPMGAGKSAVGRQLARLLHLDFVDSDEEKEGEDGFRKREAKVIDDLTQRDRIVLATGGGVVVDPANRSHLGARGFVIYLHTSVDQQVARTRRGRERPLLEQDDPRAVLEALMAVREPLYREIADLTVDTDGRKVKAVATEILDKL